MEDMTVGLLSFTFSFTFSFQRENAFRSGVTGTSKLFVTRLPANGASCFLAVRQGSTYGVLNANRLVVHRLSNDDLTLRMRSFYVFLGLAPELQEKTSSWQEHVLSISPRTLADGRNEHLAQHVHEPQNEIENETTGEGEDRKAALSRAKYLCNDRAFHRKDKRTSKLSLGSVFLRLTT